MKHLLRLSLVVAVLTLGSRTPAAAQSATADPAMTQIAAALTRIAEVMEKQLESGRLDLVMRRQDLGQRRLDRVENQLVSARRTLRQHEQGVARTEMELERMAGADLSEMTGWDAASLEAHVATMEFDLETHRLQVAELEATIARLEQEKVRRQREVEDWQAFMDRELTGLQ